MRIAIAFTLLLACLQLTSRAAATVGDAPDGLKIRAESLAIEFVAPEGWRLSRESTADQLVFYPSKTKTSPLLRLRSFQGNLSAQDRLAHMTRGLPEEEANVHFVSSEKWTAEGRRFDTASATYKQGTREWYASFTLIDQPLKLQHGFWLFGTRQDVERQWETIRASIVSAKRLRPSDDNDAFEAEPEEEKKSDPGAVVWHDEGSGLYLSSWPAGFTPDPKSLKKFAGDGLRLVPDDEQARADTLISLKGTASKPGATAEDLTAILHNDLSSMNQVSDLRRIPVRVGDLEAALLTWTEERATDKVLAHQVYFVQRDATVIKIAFEAEESWSRVRSRRSLVKDFIAGISFK